MDENVLKALAATHGLDPDKATEDEVNAAILAKAAEPETPAEVPEPEAKTEEPAPVVEEQETPAVTPDPVLVAATTQITALSTEVQELKADKAARDEADRKSRRDGIIAAAVMDGRITREAGDTHYRPLLDIDEDRGKGLIDALAPSRVTVLQRGDLASASTTTKTGSDQLLAATRARHGLAPKEA